MGCASVKLTDQQSKQLTKKYEHPKIAGEVLNDIRKKPQQYAEKIGKQIKLFTDQKCIKIPSPEAFGSQLIYQTNQGPSAWKQAQKVLKSTYPIGFPLHKNSVLCQAASKKAMQYVYKQQKSRSAKNFAPSDFIEQLKIITGSKVKKGDYALLVGMDFKIKGRNHIQNAMIGLLIDDGVSSRNNRNHLLSDKFKYYGCYTTITQEYVIVVIYLSSQNLVSAL